MILRRATGYAEEAEFSEDPTSSSDGSIGEDDIDDGASDAEGQPWIGDGASQNLDAVLRRNRARLPHPAGGS